MRVACSRSLPANTAPTHENVPCKAARTSCIAWVHFSTRDGAGVTVNFREEYPQHPGSMRAWKIAAQTPTPTIRKRGGVRAPSARALRREAEHAEQRRSNYAAVLHAPKGRAERAGRLQRRGPAARRVRCRAAKPHRTQERVVLASASKATVTWGLDDGETMRGRRRLRMFAQILWCWTNVNTKGASAPDTIGVRGLFVPRPKRPGRTHLLNAGLNRV